MAKSRAKQCLDRATKETGMKTPDDHLKSIFAMFPNELNKVEDKIHELRAQAELCEGTDRSVSTVGVVNGDHMTNVYLECCLK